MANALEQIGTFRGAITVAGLNAAESGAKAIQLTVAIAEIYHEGDWFDWTEHDLEVSGDIWVIKKDGSVNEKQVRALVEYAGWSGSFVNLTALVGQKVQIVVQEDQYRGNVRYRIAWINAYDATPGGGNVTPEKAQEIENQYGAQMRAIVGSAKTNAKPPAGKPAKPGKAGPKKPATAPAPAAPPPGEAPPDDEVPF